MKLKILKDKIVVEEWNENLEINQEVDIKKYQRPFSYYFQHLVEFDENVTIKDFMNHLFDYEDLIDLCFYGFTYGFKLKPYLKELKKPLKEETEWSRLKHIEFSWICEIMNNNNINELEFDAFVTGISKDSKILHGYSISLTPINEWKHLPIFLNKEVVVTEYKDGEMVEHLKVRKEWILYDIIGTFLYELSFHGDPEDKENFSCELNDLKEEVSIEELELMRLEKELTEAIENEDYENARKLNKEIKKRRDS